MPAFFAVWRVGADGGDLRRAREFDLGRASDVTKKFVLSLLDFCFRCFFFFCVSCWSWWVYLIFLFFFSRLLLICILSSFLLGVSRVDPILWTCLSSFPQSWCVAMRGAFGFPWSFFAGQFVFESHKLLAPPLVSLVLLPRQACC